ncbi:KAP family P-loop NTPase fold protein [Tenacibaculum salmonis]|uniref:KAP family P-loop NTPase fold protein n=1 Tax=Tenacibaculum sp. P3-BQ1 TaxID=3232310 RepID=UPI0034DDF122
MISNSPISKNNGIDLFNFEHYAKKVQKIIQNNSNNSEPLTIGIYGKWGEGKTSFLNLIDKGIDSGEKEKGQKGILKYHFNPWRYSTEEEMLFDFFDGLSKLMFVNTENETLQKVGEQLIKYSKYAKAIKVSASAGLSPSNKVSATLDISEIMKSLGEGFIGEKPVLEVIIDNINKKLEESKYKIVIFIDDIDRLDKDEIYTILKLIKLNANFNNFVYIVALDENHVAKAIGKRYGVDTKDGELFLEKIINIPIHLPKIESADFKYFFKIKLGEIINNLGFSNRVEEIKDISYIHASEYFNNGREIIRVLNSFFVSAFAIGEEVNLRDLFWIEYLKVKYTDVFDVIKKYNSSNIEELITNSTIIKYFTSILNKDEIFNEHSNKIVQGLFPEYKDSKSKMEYNKGKNLIEISNFNLKINHPNHFDKYFSYHMERKFSNVKNQEILQNIIDKNEVELKVNLIDLRDKDDLEVHRFYSVIEDFINDENINYLFFYDFLFSNLDIIPESEKDYFGLTYKLRVIELIASNLDKSSIDKEKIIQLAKKLTIHQLCYFTRTINLKIDVRKQLDRLIVSKAKEEYINKPTPFFNDLTKEHSHYKMIMSLWKEYDENSFEKYIDNQTNNFDNILKLIRNFPGFWNNEYFGDLEGTNYNYMKKIIDVDVIYQKIQEMKPELINKINIKDNMSFSISNRPSEEENVEQFIYWYKKDKNLIN